MADIKKARRSKPAGLPLPCAIECERGLLGCILISPRECLAQVRERFHGHSVFYDLRHDTIYAALLFMFRAGVAIDALTLHQHLADNQSLDQIGGIQYLNAIQDSVPSASNVAYYADVVFEKYQLRRAIQLGTSIAERSLSFSGDVSVLLDEISRDIEQLCPKRESGRFYTIKDLDLFDPHSDDNNRIGNRWLCRGGKLIIPSASGAGKSSLLMQMLTLFAMGKDFCGIQPHGLGAYRGGPLSSLIVGDENDIGDLSEMFQGTRDFLALNSFEHESSFALLDRNMKFWHAPALSGDRFLAAIESELRKHPRDICAIDPLVSFAGVDLTRQDQAAKFLRDGLTRIGEETGVIWFVVHHTPKPLRDPSRQRVQKKVSEYQYAGAGSFDLPGWARAVMTLDEATDGVFRLVLSKRGRRAGARHLDGSPATMLWMRHADVGIHWEQIEPPQVAESKGSRAGAPSKVEKVWALGMGSITDKLTEPASINSIADAIKKMAFDKGGIDIGRTKCREIVATLAKNNAIKEVEGGYIKA